MILDWFLYYLAPVARELSATCDVTVVTRDHGREMRRDGSIEEDVRSMFGAAAKVRVFTGRQRSIRSLYQLASLIVELRRLRPEIVHAQDHADWRLWILGRLIGGRRVVTVHDVDPHPGASRGSVMHRLVRRQLRRGAHTTIVHGRALLPMLRHGGQHVVVPMGLHAHEVCPGPLPDTPTVLVFGRMEPYKDFDTLVRALPIVKRRVPSLRAVVAGDGPALDEWTEPLQSLGFVQLHRGFVPDSELNALLRDASLVVLPYREASQSGVVPLAYSAARPVVATRVGALEEAVRDGASGLLVAPSDASSLADAIVGLLSDRTRLESMSAAALDLVRSGDMSPSSIARAHQRAYQATIGT